MSSATIDRSIRTHLRFWLFALIMLAAFAAVQLSVNAQFGARLSAGMLKQRTLYQLNSVAEMKAQRAFDSLSYLGRPTVQDAERILNAGKPFPQVQEGSATYLLFTDSDSGGRALLVFNGNVWSTITPYSLDPLIASAIPDPNGGLYRVLTIARRLAYMFGYFVWFGLYWAIIFERLRRPWSMPYARCVDLLCVAIVSTTLALLGLSPHRAAYDFFQDDSAGWGIFAILMSVFVFLVVHFKRTSPLTDPTPRCRTCNYNLTGNQSGRCPECGTATHILAANS